MISIKSSRAISSAFELNASCTTVTELRAAEGAHSDVAKQLKPQAVEKLAPPQCKSNTDYTIPFKQLV